MATTKFFTLFNSLTGEEVLAFGKYLKRMHAKEAVALEVFQTIRRQPEAKRGDVGHLCIHLYRSETPAIRKNLLNTLSELHLWLKDFLLFKKATAESFVSQYLWLDILREKGLENEFLHQAEPWQAEIAGAPVRNPEDCLKTVMANHLLHHNRPAGRKLPDEVMLMRLKDDLDRFYALAGIRLACELANFRNLHPWDKQGEAPPPPEPVLLPEIQSFPLFLLYQKVYRLITGQAEADYNGAIQILSAHASDIEPAEMHTLVTYLRNFATMQIRNGREEYWESVHQLNKFGVEWGVFTTDGIQVSQFNNIVTCACRVKAFDWAIEFIQTQSLHLPAAMRDNTVFLARMIVAFDKGEYEAVLNGLRSKTFNLLLENIRARALTMNCMYELEDDDTFDYCLAFEAFLRRTKQTKREAIKGTLNLVRIVKMLIQKRAPKATLLQTVENLQPLYFKSWLMQKAMKYQFARH